MEKAIFVKFAVLIFYIGYKVPQGFAQETGATKPMLTSTTPTPGNVSCKAFNTTDGCCDTNLNGSCIFLNCTDKFNKSHEECHQNNFNASEVCKESLAGNTCANTTMLTSTSPTSTPKTPTPDPCNLLGNETGCCKSEGCIYLICTNPTNSSRDIKGCLSNTTDKEKECNTTGVQNVCDISTTTSPPLASTTTNKTTHSTNATTQTTTGTLKSTPAGQTDDSPKQHFDAASFVGGIVLCLGIVAIIFFGCKFYKARTERNYHTL